MFLQIGVLKIFANFTGKHLPFYRTPPVAASKVSETILNLKLFLCPRRLDDFDPAGIYLYKVYNENTQTMCEICSKLTIKTPERRQGRRSGVFIVNFEQISHIFQVFPLLTQLYKNFNFNSFYGKF